MLKKSGFTLVELLVVVTIIGVLAAIGLTVYSSAQKSGRIAKRLEDLSAIRTALEVYNGQNKVYPTTVSVWKSECLLSGSISVTTKSTSDVVIPGLIPSFMVAFPADPSMKTDAGTSCYAYKSDGVDYKLVDYSIAEFSAADYSTQRNLVDPARSSAWAIYSSGASAW